MRIAPRRRGRFAGFVGLGAGLVLALAPGGAAAANDDYVAMGDSYSSGTGTRDYYESNCERSNFAYHRLLDGSLPGSPTAAVVACGGARTNNITGAGQHGNPGQGNDPALGTNTDYVTISIGGNDAGFSDVLVQCGLPFVSCDDDLDTAENTIRNELPGRLNSVYNLIRSRAPNARVTVVGYPRIFNGDDCNAATFFSEGEINRMNGMADLLAETTRARAQAHGFGFADARGAFLGHAVCDDPEWINGLSNPTGESYHPNKLGHANGYQGIVGSALRSQEAPTETRGPKGRIAFTRGTGSSADVYAINGNGSFPVDLPSNSAAADVDPAYSPDGTKIAFASERDGDSEIYVVNWDGSGTVSKLTNNTADDREPAWSPNGDYLAFRSNRDGNNDIYKMTAAGGSQSRLTANADSEFAPAWSPDGAEIAYQRFGSQNDVWKMNSDGQGQTRLTTDGANDGAPEYSPSGTQIAFHSNRGGGDFEIFTMNATGGSQTQRTNNSVNDERPAWSPDGGTIAFNSDRDGGDSEIYSMSPTGTNQVRLTNQPGTDAGASWQADDRAPQTTIVSGPSGRVNTATPSFDLSSDEPGSSFECSIDASTYAPCGDPHQTSALTDGDHVFRARAIDPSLNVDPSPVERSFKVDTTPAETAITAGPSGPTRESSVEFEFAAQDPDTSFTCELDGEVIEADCQSPIAISGLEDGPHVFTVIGTDGLNVDEDSSEFTVDTVAPDTSLGTGPGPVTNQTQPAFELLAEPGSTFECRIGDAEFAPCVSPYVPEVELSHGEYVLEVRATDAAGNVEAEPFTVAFAVDLEAPVATIDSGPPADPLATGDSTPSFAFSSETGAGFECRLDSHDDADWVPCTSPYVPASELSDGGHSFEVRPIDPAGNIGEAQSLRFIVDVTDPGTAITGGPGEGSYVQAAAFDFESPDDPDAVFECRVDEASEWTPCEPGMPIGFLLDGPHKFEVRAVDQVGNRDETPVVRNFTLDRAAPPKPAVSGPAVAQDPTFTFSAQENEVFDCRVDGGDWFTCASPLVVDDLPDGTHNLVVRATDRAGNQAQTDAIGFVVDTGAPALTIDGPAFTNDTTPTFELTSSEPLGADGFSCQIGVTDVDCSGGSVTAPAPAGEPDGQYTLTVTVDDPAGNETMATKSFQIDTRAPNAGLITSGPSGLTADPTPTFGFSASETNLQFDCAVDAGSFSPCSSPHTTAALADGPHTFRMRPVDRAGNAGPQSSRSFTVDTSAPLTSIDAGPRDVIREAAPTFSFSSSEAGARFECALDGGGWAPCTSPYSPGMLAAGDHVFAVRASDAAGNLGSAVARPFTIAPPEGALAIGKPKRNVKRGTATLPVTVPGAGKLQLSGNGLKKVTKSAGGAGTVKLKVTPRGRAAKALRSTGALKVSPKVTFTPLDGPPATGSKRLKLKLR